MSTSSLRNRLGRFAVLAMAGVAGSAIFAPAAQADFDLGDATGYALLFEGYNGNSLQINNGTITGNVGVGDTGLAQLNGPGTLTGNVDFSAANDSQYSDSGYGVTGSVDYSVSAVADALNTVNALNATLGGYSGATLNINLGGSGGTQTVDIDTGTLHGSNYVFNIGTDSFTNGNTLTINGDGLKGYGVVFNFSSTLTLNGEINLVGLTSDEVLWNSVGGSATFNSGTGKWTCTAGPDLNISSNGATAHSDFLDPYGTISVNHSNIVGRVMGGDCHNFMFVSGANITAPPTSVPEPGSLALLATGLLATAGIVRRRRKAPKA